MPTRLAAQKALQRLWNINPDLSEDDEIGIDHDGEPLMVASDIAQVESDSQSDSDDSDVNEDQALEMVGKDQTIWKNVNNNSQLRGRMPSDNVFIVTPGVKPSAKRMIDSPESAWRLLITENIMKRIEKHTTDKARVLNPNWSTSLQEIDSLIGIFYLRGILGLRRAPVETIWSNEFGCPYIRTKMSRDRFRQFLQFIRFDDQSSQAQRVQYDKFSAIREIYELFVDNCLRVYVPYPYLTIDEQLLPLKTDAVSSSLCQINLISLASSFGFAAT